ncbi:TetR/AcrR family transcriptional regulator [Paenibacillus filicis]|uniref:TetR/AcrR family transcriptional regulator n=1 Tax=Paenibacillus filicis TaxID=669464 RepID=A0ABU9DTH2_9BACL
MTDLNPISPSFQLILDTAEQLIGEKGCRQTTLQDIIDRTGLSKGAIYHYVSGKDELFGLILKTKMQTMNEKFNGVVGDAAPREAAGPIRFIMEGMASQTGDQHVSNKIFTYLLSQIENPKVAAVLQGVYEYSIQTAHQWISVGQQAGAIPPEVDAVKMAELFMVFTYGLRVQSVILKDEERQFGWEDVYKLISRSLL